MAFRSGVFLLLSAIVALTYSQPIPDVWPPVFPEGHIFVDKPFNASFGPYNIQAPVNFTFTYSLNVIVCVVYEEFGLPHWTQYSAENCIFYYNTTAATTDRVEFALLDAEYTIGVYLAKATPVTGDNTTVTIVVTGSVCTNTSYYDEWNNKCVEALPLPNFPHNFSEPFGAGETKFWTFTAVDRIGHVMLHLMPDGDISEVNSIMYARYNGAPLKLFHDYSDAGGELLVLTPHPGTWVFAVHAAMEGTANFEFTGQNCGTDRAGPNCTTVVMPAFSNSTWTINFDQWIYLRFEVTAAQGLLFSATTANTSFIPYIFASRGQVPSRLPDIPTMYQNQLDLVGRYSADIVNCNREFCTTVRSMQHNTTNGNEEWFVGIYSTHPSAVEFAFWFNTSCIPFCETDNHGQCLADGRCECEIDFEGVDCTISKGLGPQYIVLIIIASLVVASAIIGFVAWAYMRRKRADYEIVS